jgi:hypothetical protein
VRIYDKIFHLFYFLQISYKGFRVFLNVLTCLFIFFLLLIDISESILVIISKLELNTIYVWFSFDEFNFSSILFRIQLQNKLKMFVKHE